MGHYTSSVIKGMASWGTSVRFINWVELRDSSEGNAAFSRFFYMDVLDSMPCHVPRVLLGSAVFSVRWRVWFASAVIEILERRPGHPGT